MALQVWLPLTGNLKNQGLSDVEIPNVTLLYDTTGKIGKAFTLKTSPQLYFIEPSLVDAQIFSFAFWYKPISDSSITANWRNLFQLGDINTEGTAGTLRVQSSYGSVSSQYVISIHNNTSYGIASVGYVFTNEWDKWHHIAFTCDGNECKGYLNGTLVKTDTFNGGKLSGKIWVGADSGGANGLMNDLRIYDHALSQKEIKLLSQGLVAHYPLNDGIGGENIAWNSSLATDLTNWVKAGTWDFVTKDGFPCCHNTGAFKTTSLIYPKQTFNTTTNGMLPYNGLIITLSADVLLENVVKGTTNYFLALYKSGETIDGSWKAPTILANSGHFTYATSEVLEPSKLNGKGWTHVWVTFKWGDYAWSNTNYRLQFYARDYTGDVYIKNFKIELGEKVTPWIPNPNDALYSALGLDDGVVHDCSGYGHNGVTSPNPPVANSDSIRYFTNLQFNGSNNYIDCGVDTWLPTDQITVSLWGYMTTWGSSRLLSCTEGGGWNFEAGDGGGWRFPVYKKGLGYCFSTPTKKWADYTSGWHHIVGTFDGYVSKIYIDGELDSVSTNQSPTVKKEIGYNQSAKFFIGCEAATANPSSPYFSGKISDVRIYATALSAEDVKSLYETRASIDNYSNTYAYEFMEV